MHLQEFCQLLLLCSEPSRVQSLLMIVGVASVRWFGPLLQLPIPGCFAGC